VLAACGGVVEEAASTQPPHELESVVENPKQVEDSTRSALNEWLCVQGDPFCRDVRDTYCDSWYEPKYCCEEVRIACTCDRSRRKWVCLPVIFP
jgi:hypothetical protein